MLDIMNQSSILNFINKFVISQYFLWLLALAFLVIITMLTIRLSKKNRQKVKYPTQTRFINISPSARKMINLAIEIWRIKKRVNKINTKLSENEQRMFQNSLRNLDQFIGDYDLEVIDYTGREYNEGMNLEVESIEGDKSKEKFVIVETLEPTVLHKGEIIKKSKVILGESN